MADEIQSAPAPSAVTGQNAITLGLLLLAALLGGLGIGQAFSRMPFAGVLVLAAAVLAVVAALSSLWAGQGALREVIATRRAGWRHLVTLGILGAEAWYASFLLAL